MPLKSHYRDMNISLIPARIPHEYGIMPFWFWNDHLDGDVIRSQIADFERHGIGGFVIHPRVGLPRTLGWMSDALLNYYEIAIKEADRRGLKVILYDEAMYPSGSSCGQVVAADADYQCRGLVALPVVDGQPPAIPRDATRVAVVPRAAGGRIVVIERKIDSVIRGLHYVGEGPGEDTPPAADILNPDAVATFIRLVYDGFAKRLAPHFGRTVIGIFTDEPGLVGRCREQGVMPGTRGILGEVNRILGYDFTPHLPALWFDDEPEAARFRADYHRAMLLRLGETYYAPLQSWCEGHGLELMGHPEGPDHIESLRYFHTPGQDLVWRWVLPDHPTALEGDQSTQAKCSAAAMVHGGRRRNLNEYCGGYGHELTFDEMNWLSNWCLVRGVNLLVPHAFYYSTRGVRRDERPPDVGPNSSWWDRFPDYAAACRRLCWINTDSGQVCRLAILGHDFSLPWRAAKICFQNQYDFNYLGECQMLQEATVDDDGVHIGPMHYERLIVEDTPQTREASVILDRLSAKGRLLRYSAAGGGDELLAGLRRWSHPDVRVVPAAPALRVRRVIKEGSHYVMLFNEEAGDCNLSIALPVEEPVFELNPVDGTLHPLDLSHPLHFSGHAMKVLVSRARSSPPGTLSKAPTKADM